MAVAAAGANVARMDRDVATRTLTMELQDKGFLLTRRRKFINWAVPDRCTG